MKGLFLILALLLSVNVYAADTQLTWVAPTEREDGTALTDGEISLFKIYYGTAPGNYINNVDVIRTTPDGILPSDYQLTLPTGFTYYFVVTTVDTDGRESVYSSEVFIPLEHTRPNAPTVVIVIKLSVN